MLPAFTLLCDPFSPIANGAGLARRAMQAHLILTTILFGEVRLSDTQCLTSTNLADLITSDSVTRELVGSAKIKIAVRDRQFDGSPMSSLHSLVGTFGSNRFVPEARATFEKCAAHIERNATTVEWQMAQVSSFYTEHTLALLNSEARLRGFHRTRLHKRVSRFIDERLEASGGSLKRDYIRLDALDHATSSGQAVPSEYAKFLEDVSSAFYFSAVPSVLGSSTVYDVSHRQVIKLRDGLDLDPAGGAEVTEAHSPVNLRYYLDAMALLDVDDVGALIESTEARRYRGAIEAHLNGPTTTSFFEVRACLFELHARIDETLLGKDRRFRADPGVNNVRRARTLIDSASGATNFVLSVVPTLLGLPPIPGLGAAVGISARQIRESRFGDGRLATNTEARKRAAQLAYEDQLIRLGKADVLELSVRPELGSASIKVSKQAFMAP